MLVRRVKEFIESLSALKDKLPKRDLKFLTLLENRFCNPIIAENGKEVVNELLDFEEVISGNSKASSLKIESMEGDLELFQRELTGFQEKSKNNDFTIEKNANTILDEPLLNANDIALIEGLFVTRWHKIAGKPHDYTFYSGGINEPWVLFAKDLAIDLKKHYFKILIPVLANSFDPNNFSRLEQAPEPRSIYLSNDNTWHRLLALYEELKKSSGAFGIRDKPKSGARLRALSLDELNRIRSKWGDGQAFTASNGISYISFWDYVKKVIAPTWKDNGACSTYLLPYLLDIIEKCLDLIKEPRDLKGFQFYFRNFIDYLAKRPLAEVNNFYGMQIKVNGENHFLVEILLDCLKEDKNGLNNKLLNVVECIYTVNPALVSQNENLKSVYEDIEIRTKSKLHSLRDLILNLNINSTDNIKPLQVEIFKLIEQAIEKGGTGNEKEFREQIVSKIREMYALRGDRVIDTKYDYFRMQNGVNYPWFRLGQYLAGAKYIDPNYFKLLISTLSHDEDPITTEPLTNYPLSKYILSTNGRQLIFLPNCVRHYKVNGTFYNCNYREPMPLSHKEKIRLSFADPGIYDFFLRIEEKPDDPPLSKEMIDEIRKMVNGILNPYGLTNRKVSKSEKASARKFYEDFYVYVSKLPTEEKNRLHRHRILLGSSQASVREIMNLIQTKDCMASNGRYFAKLVMDYAPYSKFNYSIEQQVDIESMRATSAKRVYSNYDELTEEEATRRILIIMTSLFTHPFQYIPLTGTPITLGNNYSNIVTGSGYEIFNLFAKSIRQSDFSQARFLYVQFREDLLPSQVNKNSWLRYDDTLDWLKRIQNDSIYNDKQKSYFQPELLLTNLWSVAKEIRTKNYKLSEAIESFLSVLYALLISSEENIYKKWIMVNIDFIKFLNSDLILDHRGSIMQLLNQARQNIYSQETFIQESQEFFVHRLAQNNARAPNFKVGLHGVSPGNISKTYNSLKDSLNKKFESTGSTQDDNRSLDNLVSRMQKVTGTKTKKDFANCLKQAAPQITLPELALRV
ncbi:MAG: hypothetical protein H0U73_08400 [Tatlockia sp.]|nr:hypothetical protein [Tatlockia sp.]